MAISGLVKRLVKGSALTAAEHDGNLDAIETAVDAKASTSALSAKVSGTGITAIVALTVAEFSAIDPKGATTLYILTDSNTGDANVWLGNLPLTNQADY